MKSYRKDLSVDDFESSDNNDNDRIQHKAPSTTADVKATANTTFQPNVRLRPEEVYIATIGAFQKSNFQLKHVIRRENDTYAPASEEARVYQKVDDGMLYILYFPGRDNEKAPTKDNHTRPLKDIIENANKEIASQFGEDKLNRAKKIFMVAESNSYYGIPVMHYIKADLTNGVLTTDDSIDRNYNESYLDNLLPHTKRIAIKRGLQPMLHDTWSCGHHTIHRIYNDINCITDTKEFSVDAEALATHYDLYQEGYSTWPLDKKPKNIIDPNKVLPKKSEIYFSTSSKFGLNPPHVTLESITKMFRALALDNNLEIIPIKNDMHDRTLRIYTPNQINKLNQLGLKLITPKDKHPYYELTITIDDFKLSDKSHLPPFYLSVKVDNKTIVPLDVSHILSTENIREARKKPHRNLTTPASHNSDEGKILDIVQKTNIYMKTLLGHDIEKINYADKNYLYRLHSWNKILKTFDDVIHNKTDLATLIELIEKEASTFKAMHHSKRYTGHLSLLADALTKHPFLTDPHTKLATKISNYSDLYQQIKNLHTQSAAFNHEPRLFQSHLAAKEREMELYHLLKSNLAAEDRHSFPSLAREKSEEQTNRFTNSR